VQPMPGQLRVAADARGNSRVQASVRFYEDVERNTIVSESDADCRTKSNSHFSPIAHRQLESPACDVDWTTVVASFLPQGCRVM
jgi:hypothetical protein